MQARTPGYVRSVQFSGATDGFRLACDRFGHGPPVLLLHGWPGERGDWRSVATRLSGLDVIVPDLRRIGASDRHLADPATAYSAAALSFLLLTGMMLWSRRVPRPQAPRRSGYVQASIGKDREQPVCRLSI